MNNSNRPRILHITRNLPPLVGGMERMSQLIVNELNSQAEIKIIGHNRLPMLKFN